jgi:WD40 repeat protein
MNEPAPARPTNLLPGTISPVVRKFLARCLQRDPKQRVQAIGGSGVAERLTEGTMRGAVPTSALPDGSGFLYAEPDGSRDIWMVKVTGPRTGQRLIATAANEQNGVVSPDSRWLAYQSNESGRDEIVVQNWDQELNRLVPAR